MVLLDTNVLSALMRHDPDERVVLWLDLQPRHSVWITAVTEFEIWSGLQTMVESKRRQALTEAFTHQRHDLLQGRVAHFDSAAAYESAKLMATRQSCGMPVELRDTMIAGITLATHATLATRNVKHFADIAASVINPWNT